MIRIYKMDMGDMLGAHGICIYLDICHRYNMHIALQQGTRSRRHTNSKFYADVDGFRLQALGFRV
jgi:hypothetical protein